MATYGFLLVEIIKPFTCRCIFIPETISLDSMSAIFLYILLLITVTTDAQQYESVIAFEPSYISITIGDKYSVNVRLLLPDLIPPNIFIEFLYNNQLDDTHGYINPIPNITFTKQTSDDQSRVIIINARHQGHIVVTSQSPQVNISAEYDFLLIDIARSRILNVFIQLVGWIYFFAWSISFYPQIILNFRRQSVVGLNFDFLALNLLGHSCYSIFNICLYTSYDVQQEYYTKHPHGILPVLLNDVRDVVECPTDILIQIAFWCYSKKMSF